MDGKCTQGVRSGTELLSFPESSAFAPGVVEKELASVLNVQDLDDVTALALYLICVKYGILDSQFKEYVDSLPETLDLPMFWTDAELEYLRGSALLEKVNSIKVRISEEFSSVLEALPAEMKKDITLDRYTWAQGILFSRAFELPSSLPIVLLPGADSFPTSRSGNSVVRATKGGLFGQDKNVALVADSDIFSGDQVVVTRNAESNSQFLIDYGIVYENSPTLDTVDLEFGVSPLDPYYDDKVDILQEMNMSISLNFRVTAGCKEYREEDIEQLEYVAQYLRLVCLGGPDAFLLEAVFRSDVWDFMALPVSKENEQTMCESVIAACEEQLESFGENTEAKAGSKRAGLARVIVDGERSALEGVVAHFQRELKLLDGKQYYQERRLSDLDLLRPVDASEVVDSESAGRAARSFDDYY
ncbi:hypothetical protein NDN08_002402 [Rhodosorus marinus]|uniref:Rubisco LSMT substrate-binding domain-containing protein n=1 Tax=Rhodosorus marinus TaxID=101924 RepID=A0AAV8UTN4_9RHOD|nr:hypothetical protein NDN08_002402 [Rhodosorus marinus]